jgi:hypothetical protein
VREYLWLSSSESVGKWWRGRDRTYDQSIKSRTFKILIARCLGRRLNYPCIALIHHSGELIGFLVLVRCHAQHGSVAHGLHHNDCVPRRRRGSLRGRKVQIQVSRAVELEGCCAVDLAHGDAQVPLVGVDVVQAVVRGEDGYGGEG